MQAVDNPHPTAVDKCDRAARGNRNMVGWWAGGLGLVTPHLLLLTRFGLAGLPPRVIRVIRVVVKPARGQLCATRLPCGQRRIVVPRVLVKG